MPLRYSSTRRDSTSGSECSDASHHSHSTAPTVYSVPAFYKQQALLATTPHFDHPPDQALDSDRDWERSFYSNSDRALSEASFQTYASTTPSEADPVEYDCPLYEEPEQQDLCYTSSALASTPAEFAAFFPSTRRLNICHDDTVDGNMNLRVDTEAQTSTGRRVDLTLFHLRMHDLKNREFSLRRYARDSGREVCHSSRKYTKPALDRRPGLHRSMSNALATLRSKSDSKTSTKSSLKRADSGYHSDSDDSLEASYFDRAATYPAPKTSSSTPLPTNTTKLEYSNYAHVDLKRRGAKSAKRYAFDFWGAPYAWKRVVRQSDRVRETSFHLYNTDTNAAVAHIVPNAMTPAETAEEEAKGGWVPPCSMWISDERIFAVSSDIADVIVSTGLLALVDDSIKSRWHQKGRFHFNVPSMAALQYIGPKRLIDEVFRRGSTAPRSPLRQLSLEQ